MPIEKPNANYDNMSEKMRFIIDCYANYWSPSRVHKAIQENFEQNEHIKLSTVVGYKMQYENLILEKRKELMEETPIMNPAARMRMAQEVYDMAMNGYDKMTKAGIVNLPDPKTAIEAVKAAHSFSSTKDGGEVLDSDIIRTVVKETFENIRAANPDLSDLSIAEMMMETLNEDAKPYIQELSGAIAS